MVHCSPLDDDLADLRRKSRVESLAPDVNASVSNVANSSLAPKHGAHTVALSYGTEINLSM